MKVFEFCLKPVSDFATELQGDCLFGQICWQLAQDSNLAGKISELLADYDTNPFCVVADPCMVFDKEGRREYLLKTPFAQPPQKNVAKGDYEQQKRQYAERKLKKRFKWTIVSIADRLEPMSDSNLVDSALVRSRYNLADDWEMIKTVRQTHNSIDRITGTTGTGSAFAPYASNLVSWYPETKFALFAGVREGISIKGIYEALRRIGLTGYGADASSGKGRFELVGEPSEVNLNEFGSKKPDSICVLSPVVPEDGMYEKICFEPFVRFGRHGNKLATSSTPFKQPILKAATGAVLTPTKNRWPPGQIVGCAVKDISHHKETVDQGYALFIPVRTEAGND